MRFLVTAGPTREFLDPVRFISNRSSGKMGFAVAAAARDRGHDVVLISGPVSIPPPSRVSVVPVVSAADMLAAVEHHVESCDVLVMAAAVADWRPASVSGLKMKKLASSPELKLEPTVDILRAIQGRKGGRAFIGFAAETDHVEAEARRKLASKGLDMIVANDVSQPDAGFDVDTNRVVLISANGEAESLPLMSKADVAKRIVEWVEKTAACHLECGGLTPLSPLPGLTGQRPESIHEAGTGIGASSPAEEKRCQATALQNGHDRLSRQLDFIREIDKLKSIYRRTLLMDGTRFENDAEHSWHLAVMAVLLAEHANQPSLDLARVIKMVLIHDIVEIDAGDTYCYDDAGNLGKLKREEAAADRLFGLLPDDQRREVRSLWEEFEARVTPEAKFSAALDRVQPLMHNYCTGGVIWKKHGVRSDKVRDRNRHVEEGSRELWLFAENMIQDAVARGYLDA